MTRSIFVKDQVKGLAVSLVITTPLVAGIIKIIHWAGQDAILRIVAWAIVFMCALFPPGPSRPQG